MLTCDEPDALLGGSGFTRRHLGVFLILWIGFSGLTFAIVRSGLDDSGRQPMLVLATTAGTIAGPMTGAISRNFQQCCLQASLSLLPWCLSALALAAGFQFVPGRSFALRALCLAIWAAGLIVWFGGGIVSFFHALS